MRINASLDGLLTGTGSLRTYEYTVTDTDTTITANAAFTGRTVSGITSPATVVSMYANDANNISEDALKQYIDSLEDVLVTYDNGETANIKADWILDSGSWDAKGGTYTYKTSVNGNKAMRQVQVDKVTASITQVSDITLPAEDKGYASAALGLPDTVSIDYTPSGANIPIAFKTGNIIWSGWTEGWGKASAAVTMTGTVSLPAWATGINLTTTNVNIIDKISIQLTNITVDDKTYDGKVDATYTINGTIGLIAKDEVSLLNDVYIEGTPIIKFADKNAGTDKGVSVTGVTLKGMKGKYYRLDFENLKAGISKLAVTVIPKAANKRYGYSDPVYGFDIDPATPLIQGDNLINVLKRSAGEAPGNYEFNKSDTADRDNPNYSVTAQPGIFLTIFARPIPPDPPTPPAPPAEDVREVPGTAGNSENKPSVGILIKRNTDSEGNKIDTINLSEQKTKEAAENAIRLNSDAIATNITDIPGNNADRIEYIFLKVP